MSPCWARVCMSGGIGRLPMLERWRRWSARAKGRWGKRGWEFGISRSVFVHTRIYAYAQELGDDCGRGNLDKDDVVEADAVERVEQREATLDLVGFDHALQDVLDGDALTLACQVIRDGEDGSEIVGRVSP